MGKLTYKKRTTKRNSNKCNITSNKRNITKRKLLKKGGDDDDGVPIKSVDTIEGVVSIVVPIENYDKTSIQQKIKKYIKTKEITDINDPMYYLDKIIPIMMAQNNITVDNKTEYLKLLITKFLENNIDNNEIPKNMSSVVKLAVKQYMYKTECTRWKMLMGRKLWCKGKKNEIDNMKSSTNVVSIEMVSYILQSCLYFLEYGDPTEKKDYYGKPIPNRDMYILKFNFLQPIVIDILKFFFTSRPIDFNRHINRDINDRLNPDLIQKFKNLKSMDEYKLKYFVDSILYSNKDFKKDYKNLIDACSYSNLKKYVGENGDYLIITQGEFLHIKETTITEPTESKSTKSHVEWTPVSDYVKGKGIYNRINLF